MAINVNWAFNVAIDAGPRISLVNVPKISIDAYDMIIVKVDAGTNVSVDLQPTTTAGNVVMLAITSDVYDDGVAGDVVTYTHGGGANKLELDGPHLLMGPGAVALLGSAPPASLSFSNSLTKPVNLQILVGRKV